ncbi:MAG: hypothetical protein INR69_14435 [Mucilaginibacter polytrichastri]|nr:hypothetical protein [Mucilaginibacter polytrichastri]
MKKPMFSISLICLILFISACHKEDNISPSGVLPRTGLDNTPPAACETEGGVQYVLSNSTGVDGFTIIFAGEQVYTFYFPKQGRTEVSVKPGIYNILIPPNDQIPHMFTVGNEKSIHGVKAAFQQVRVSSCDINQVAQIH